MCLGRGMRSCLFPRCMGVDGVFLRRGLGNVVLLFLEVICG